MNNPWHLLAGVSTQIHSAPLQIVFSPVECVRFADIYINGWANVDRKEQMTSVIVQPIGNALGVVLPDEVLARLNAKVGDLLYLTQAPNAAVLITTQNGSVEAQMQAAEEGMAKYRHCLRELAK